MSAYSGIPRVIAPNLKRRLSGVTATIVRLVPIQARSIAIVATGPGLPPGLPHLPLWRLLFLDRATVRVWHGRRNTEMLFGLVLRHVFRRRLKLMFTSASQRRHSRYTKWLIARMDAVVATSRKSAAFLERDAEVIMHGIDLRGFDPPGDRAALRHRLGLPNGVLVGCYGRIRAQKGTDAFVDAMVPVLQARSDVTALVMGRATGRHADFLLQLKARIAELGLSDRVLFLPEVTVDAMPVWYQALDLFVAPQRWEGFGLTPLEAMACGVPVVATDVGAFSEQVVPGTTGSIVPPDNVAALTRAIDDLVGAPGRRVRMGAAARAHVLDAFDIEREARALNSLYEALLRDAPRL